MTTFDALDRVVIEQLQRDGRASFQDIAQACGATAELVAKRAHKLEASGVLSVVAVTDPLKLGFPRQALLGIEVDGVVGPTARALSAMVEVIYVVRVSNRIDLLAEVVGSSDARLLEMVAQIRLLPGVRRIHPSLISEVIKETYAFGIA